MAYDQAAANYGVATPAVKAAPPKQRRRMNLVAICQNLLLPWLFFSGITAVMGFSVHYNHKMITYMIVVFCFIAVVFVGVMAIAYMRKKRAGTAKYHTWMVFLFLALAVAWLAGVIYGDMIFYYHMQPFYDLQNLNTYPDVDPSYMKGQQLMDGGSVFFRQGTLLDLKRSMGFKNLDLYCVAPITMGLQPLASYDFWAVGMNCCSGNYADFHCGEFNNPNARSGLRLMHDDQRPFYRLAVQQAEALYNLKATHPLFFIWVQDPQAETVAYKDNGYRTYILGMFGHFIFNLFCVVVASYGFAKMGYY